MFNFVFKFLGPDYFQTVGRILFIHVYSMLIDIGPNFYAVLSPPLYGQGHRLRIFHTWTISALLYIQSIIRKVLKFIDHPLCIIRCICLCIHKLRHPFLAHVVSIFNICSEEMTFSFLFFFRSNFN